MLRVLPMPRSRVAPRPDLKAATARAGFGATALATGLAIAAGVLLGIVATAATLRSDLIGTMRMGPWRFDADAGSMTPNPYQRARMARSGEIPLAAAEGFTLVARHDSAGDVLDGRCRYRVSGSMPPARFWSLQAAATSGRPVAAADDQEVFTSADVLRDAAGQSVITLAPTVEPGNWLSLPGSGHFALVLRLYETGIAGLPLRGGGSGNLPSIVRLGCSG